MKSEVRHPDGPPSRPKQIVELILTPAEFGALYLLHYRHGGGSPNGIRGEVEDGLYKALEKLHPEYAASIRAVATTVGRYKSSAYQEIDRIIDQLQPS